MIRIPTMTPLSWSLVILVTWVILLSIAVIGLPYEIFVTFLIAILLFYLLVQLWLMTKTLWFLAPLVAWLILIGSAVVNISNTAVIIFLLACWLVCEIAEFWPRTYRFLKK